MLEELAKGMCVCVVSLLLAAPAYVDSGLIVSDGMRRNDRHVRGPLRRHRLLHVNNANGNEGQHAPGLRPFLLLLHPVVYFTCAGCPNTSSSTTQAAHAPLVPHFRPFVGVRHRCPISPLPAPSMTRTRPPVACFSPSLSLLILLFLHSNPAERRRLPASVSSHTLSFGV